MKKILSLFIVITMLLSLPLFIYAEGEAETLPPPVSEDMAELLNSQFSPEEKEIIFNKSYYSEELSGTTLNDVPMLKVYLIDYVDVVSYTSNTLSSFIPTLSDIKTYDVVLLDTSYVAINVDERKSPSAITKSKKIGFPSQKLMFLDDIRTLQKETYFFETKCTVQQIFCFFGGRDNVTVAIVTDKGFFIKLYDDYYDESVLLSEEDFIANVQEFQQYLQAKSEILNRIDLTIYGEMNLLDYLISKREGRLQTLEEFEANVIAQKQELQEWFENQESNKTQTDTEAVPTDTAPAEPEGQGLSPWVWVAIVSGAALVIAVPTAAVVISKSKKKNS